MGTKSKMMSRVVCDREEMIHNAQKTCFFQDVSTGIIKGAITGKFDKLDAKKADDWNSLSHQIVGRET
jgi:hypothetical protein